MARGEERMANAVFSLRGRHACFSQVRASLRRAVRFRLCQWQRTLPLTKQEVVA